MAGRRRAIRHILVYVGLVPFCGSLMAGALLVGVPAALVFNLALDRFVRGLTVA